MRVRLAGWIEQLRYHGTKVADGVVDLLEDESPDAEV